MLAEMSRRGESGVVVTEARPRPDAEIKIGGAPLANG